MAVTSIWPIKSRIDRVLNYIKNPEKVTESYYTEEEPLHILDGVMGHAMAGTQEVATSLYLNYCEGSFIC